MTLKSLAIASCLALLGVAYTPSAKADEWNKKTILTVNEPLAIPGTVLQPGKYVMKLADSLANRHIVQVFNEDQSKLETTILAIPNYRLQPTGKTEFSFWESAAGQPRALKAWFYPGDNFGQEFAYPKELASQIAKASSENVPAIVSGENNLGQAEVKEITPSGEEQAMSSSSAQSTTSTEPSSEATAQAQTETTPTQTTPSTAENNPNTTGGQTGVVTAPETAQTQPQNTQMTQPSSQSSMAANRTLPRTASSLPLLGLLGLLSLAAAGAARVTARRLR